MERGWPDQPGLWRRAARAARVFVVVPEVSDLRGGAWGSRLGPRFSLAARHTYPGVIPVSVFEYRRTGGPAPRTRLVRRGGQEVVVRRDGTALPVEPSATGGFVEAFQVSSFKRRDHWRLGIKGWAVDTARRRPARVILGFAGGRLLLAGRPTKPRPDIAESVGETARRSGFDLSLVRDGAAALAEPRGLRLFSIGEGHAWELRRLHP